MSGRLHVFLAPQKRGLVAFTPELRRRLRLDEPGAQLEVMEHDDGTFSIRGVLPVDADQTWFWTDRWQKMESEADVDISAGRVTSYESVEALLSDLES